MNALTAFVPLLLFAACAQQAAFRPTDNVGATGYGGQPAASYQVRSAPGADPDARVEVWSRGARIEDGVTMIDLVMSLRNVGDRPIQLRASSLALDVFDEDGRRLPPPGLVRATDPRMLIVPPGMARDVHLQYAMPIEISPTALGGLRLRWALRHDSQQYVQFTDFRRAPEVYARTGYVGYAPLYGWYDPFWHPHPFFHRDRVIVVERPIVRDHRRRPVRRVR